jgi:hypothetical protein
MAEENKPEEKPSFFDFADQARSWPPADGFNTDDEDEIITSGGSFFDKPKPNAEEPQAPNGLEQILSIPDEAPIPQPVNPAPQPAPIEPPRSQETDLGYIDMLLDNFGAIRDISFETSAEPRQEEDFLVPKSQANVSAKKFDEESNALDDIFNQKEIAPSYITPSAPSNEDDEEGVFSINDLKNNPEPEPDMFSSYRSKQKPPPQEDLLLNKALSSVSQEGFDESSFGSQAQETTSDFNPYDDFPAQAPSNEDILPFRTYSKSDYSEEKIEDAENEEDKAPMDNLLANRNLVILLAVIVFFMGYFIYNKVFNRKYVANGTKRTRRLAPRKDKLVINTQQELVPVWEISNQEGSKYYEELKLVKSIYSVGGRDNPFAMPDSIVADLRRRVEADIVKQQQPNNFRRIAYRATLIGVLASKDSMIALVNQQEADFDVIEGTGKIKVLKLATKAMERAKQNTQEMVVGSYIGPWVITRIDSPENAFVDAKVHVEYKGITKILSMGKATELGIFTSEGLIDNLENPVGTTSLDKTPVAPSEEFDSFEE